jgi:hypothetical protein
MKDINLRLQQLCDYEIKIVTGASKSGCDCRCTDADGHSFRIDCAPNIDYCEYLCKEILFSTVNVKKCSGECDASGFHGRYPGALEWVEKKKEEQEV